MKLGNGEDKNMYQKHYNRNDGLSPNEKVQYNLMICKIKYKITETIS